MSSPHRHPRTGVYKFRKRVPERLRGLVGRTEITISLGTRDPREARRLHAEVAAQVEREWAALAAEPVAAPALRRVVLTAKQAHALAGEAYRSIVARLDEDPGSPRMSGLFAARARTAHNLARRGRLDMEEQEFVEQVAGGFVDGLLEKFGMILDEDSRPLARRAMAQGVSDAQAAIARRADGDWSPDPAAAKYPPFEALDILDWSKEFERYADEVRLKEKTRKSWRKRVAELMAFVGSDDLRKLRADHVEDWKTELLESGLHPNTVRNGYLAAAKALCAFLARKLPVNPTAGVTVRRIIQPKTREKGFSLAEARTILRATLEPPAGRMSPDQKAARRWVPWLCAYTGARVNEITQLRRKDVKLVESEGGEKVWVIEITPEAGTVKGGGARSVPLHPHLLEQGFLDFVRSCDRPTLFYDNRRLRGGSKTHPLYQKTGERLAAWVRGLGIDHIEVDPNHGWRHRFKSVARSKSIEEATIDHLQGHTPATVGEGYGDRWPAVLFEAISRLPRYDVVTFGTATDD
jgi:integrase